ncbi:MAG TPA: endonuclease Q family protein [Candidatus Dojkabacteria bacterium]|nr:endonuclease Q family protein [Candidatus Dojkabacteria bacterium]
MKLIVDLHLHSHYSRSTSPDLTLENIYKWGKIKGINIIGTADFTHPLYLQEIKEKLIPAEPGLFTLREDLAKEIDSQLPASVRSNLMRFILSTEISNIYSKNEKVRKMHNMVILPDFKSVDSLNSILSQIGNLKADGRPILGLDSKKLLEIVIGLDEYAQFIPAHIWTPWFSLYGSRSGFNSIEEAFEELSDHIKIVETGLSSDPFMNWRIKDLDGLTLISDSDAHSAQKLGREANMLDIDLDYQDLISALRSNDERMLGTIEFFPQEGKYHYDGHRSCNVFMSPSQSAKVNGICPVCGKPLIIGVDNRVNELADRSRGEDFKPKKHKLVEYIIPLAEILAELNNTKSTTGKRVTEQYHKLINSLGSEFEILRKIDINTIKGNGFKEVAQAISKLRQRDVYIKPGYDGVYGIIKVFPPKEHDKGFQLGLLN